MTGFSTPAILLRRIDLGDYDLIISFLTLLKGKISVVAKNAKKSRKRFSGLLDPFTALNLVCWIPRHGGMPILQEASMQAPFAGIRGDLVKTAYASYWAETIHGWLEEGRPQPGIYHLLHYALDALDQDMQAPEALSIIFQMRFASLTGFAPELKICGICGTFLDRMVGNHVIFDLAKGSIVCKGCSACESRYRLALSRGTVKQLAWIQEYDIEAAARIRFTKSSIREGLRAMESFVPYHLGRVPRSLKFLNDLRHW